MSTPFFRGFNRLDFFFAGWLQAAQLYPGQGNANAIAASYSGGQVIELDGTALVPPALVQINDHDILVSVAGTFSGVQWALDFLGSPQTEYMSIPGAVAAYFGAAALDIWSQIERIISPYLATHRIVFMGHSLGGAIAQILTSIVGSTAQQGLSCLSLAAPRVGDPVFADAIFNNVFRIVNTEDPIPGLPPELWASAQSRFPLPGNPPVAIYVHTGAVQTLDVNGDLTPGDNPPSIPEIAQILYQGYWVAHDSKEYVRRIYAGMFNSEFTDPSNGYADGAALLATYLGEQPKPSTVIVPEGSGPMNLVEIFYELYERGPTERFWTPLADYQGLKGLITGYLTQRLGIATIDMKWVYARVSNFPATRKVIAWFSPAALNGNYNGTFSGQLNSAAPADDAMLLRGLSDAGGTFRQFLHGFPLTQVKGEDVNFSVLYKQAVDAYIAYLINTSTNIRWATVPDNTVADRQPIASIVPITPRGASVVAAIGATLPAVNDHIYIGGAGSKQVGMKGKKVVTNVNVGTRTFEIGGVSPIGTMQAGAYYYLENPIWGGATQAAIERLSEHRVGKVFGLRPGRQSSVIPLRQ